MAKLLSSFELLVKPIASAMPLLPGGDRTIVQAYLLLLSNLNPISEPEVALRLKFTVGGMPLNSRKLLTIFDPGTGNQFDTLDVNGKTGDLVLPSGFTGLFWLQSDLRQPDVLPAPPNKPNLEIRGYVEAEVSPKSATSNVKLLITPQHRSMFFSSLTASDCNQKTCLLSTAWGGALIEFP